MRLAGVSQVNRVELLLTTAQLELVNITKRLNKARVGRPMREHGFESIMAGEKAAERAEVMIEEWRELFEEERQKMKKKQARAKLPMSTWRDKCIHALEERQRAISRYIVRHSRRKRAHANGWRRPWDGQQGVKFEVWKRRQEARRRLNEHLKLVKEDEDLLEASRLRKPMPVALFTDAPSTSGTRPPPGGVRPVAARIGAQQAQRARTESTEPVLETREYLFTWMRQVFGPGGVEGMEAVEADDGEDQAVQDKIDDIIHRRQAQQDQSQKRSASSGGKEGWGRRYSFAAETDSNLEDSEVELMKEDVEGFAMGEDMVRAVKVMKGELSEEEEDSHDSSDGMTAGSDGSAAEDEGADEEDGELEEEGGNDDTEAQEGASDDSPKVSDRER